MLADMGVRFALATRGLQCDSQKMKRLALFSLAVALLSCSAAYGSILNELLGTWNATTTYKEGGRTISFTSRNVVKRLGGGVISIVGTETSNGRQVVDSKEWMLPGGVSLRVGYDEARRTDAIAEGTWRIRGNVLSGTYALETLREGRISWAGSARRINRNRWEQTVTMREGKRSFTYKTVYTRVR
jgi:hypothetical protein